MNHNKVKQQKHAYPAQENTHSTKQLKSQANSPRPSKQPNTVKKNAVGHSPIKYSTKPKQTKQVDHCNTQDESLGSLFEQMLSPNMSIITPLNAIFDEASEETTSFTNHTSFIHLTNAIQDAINGHDEAIHFECEVYIPNLGKVQVVLDNQLEGLSIALCFKQKNAFSTAKKHKKALTKNLSESLEKNVFLDISLSEEDYD